MNAPAKPTPKENLAAAATAACVVRGVAPPHDLDAERWVLGSMLLDNSTIDGVRGVLPATDFYHPAHAAVAEGIFAVRDRGVPVDTITLANELRSRDRLNTVGGILFIAELLDVIPTSAHILHHARIVASLAALRRCLGAASIAAAECLEDAAVGNVADVVARASRRFEIVAESLAATTSRPLRGRGMAELVDDSCRRFEERLAGKAGAAVPTPIGRLNRVLGGGLWPGQVVILAARPADGKSSLALQIAECCTASVGPAVFLSLEMPASEQVDRLVCARAGVPLPDFRAGRLSEQQMGSISEAMAAVYRVPLVFEDFVGASANLANVAAVLRRQVELGAKLGVIDYLQLVQGLRSKGDTREAEVASVSRGLKRLAVELNIPILALSQLKRLGDAGSRRSERRPTMEDLRESGAIEQDADVVTFIHHDRPNGPGGRWESSIIVAKQRNGSTEDVPVVFLRDRFRFTGTDDERDGNADAPDTHWTESY